VSNAASRGRSIFDHIISVASCTPSLALPVTNNGGGDKSAYRQRSAARTVLMRQWPAGAEEPETGLRMNKATGVIRKKM
jgi:hypothetical protein